MPNRDNITSIVIHICKIEIAISVNIPHRHPPEPPAQCLTQRITKYSAAIIEKHSHFTAFRIGPNRSNEIDISIRVNISTQNLPHRCLVIQHLLIPIHSIA